MKKIFSFLACFGLVISMGLVIAGCKPKAIDMTYSIQASCSDYNYKDKLNQHFDFTLKDNTYTITAKDTIANAILARSNSNQDGLKLSIYLTNSSEKFYNAKLERASAACLGLTLDATDVKNSTIEISISATTGDLVGAKAISIIVNQGSVGGVVSLNNKGEKQVELRPVNIKINVVLFNASAND